jgi:hypothetical protein
VPEVSGNHQDLGEIRIGRPLSGDASVRPVGLHCLGVGTRYPAKLVFPVCFTFAHLALAAALILALPAALIFRVFLGPLAVPFPPFRCLAHRALCAAAILRRALADMVRLGVEDPRSEGPLPKPRIWVSSDSRFSIRSLTAAARRSWDGVRLASDCIRGRQTKGMVNVKASENPVVYKIGFLTTASRIPKAQL